MDVAPAATRRRDQELCSLAGPQVRQDISREFLDLIHPRLDAQRYEKVSILQGATGVRGVWSVYGLRNDRPHGVPVEERGLQPRLISHINPRVVQGLAHGLTSHRDLSWPPNV